MRATKQIRRIRQSVRRSDDLCTANVNAIGTALAVYSDVGEPDAVLLNTMLSLFLRCNGASHCASLWRTLSRSNDQNDSGALDLCLLISLLSANGLCRTKSRHENESV